MSEASASGEGDPRSKLERLDDLQATHPFPYNLVVGALIGAVFLLIGVQPFLAVVYVVSYASLRWYLWQHGRVLRRQYNARAARWADKQAMRRRAR
ncbi:MAG: hypothetical protein WD691_11770 [Acidimicrobiales bacterium]